jgi:uncharacterized protein with HEPN domain
MLTKKDNAILLNLLDSLDKIIEYSSRFQTPELFKKDSLNFDATMMNFIVIGEMVDKLSEDFIKEHNEIDWPKIYGLRNVIAHDYFGIYEKEIWQIIQKDIPDLKRKIVTIIS